MHKLAIATIISFSLILAGCSHTATPAETPPIPPTTTTSAPQNTPQATNPPEQKIIIDEGGLVPPGATLKPFPKNLKDVSGGNSNGYAVAYSGESYTLLAGFENLPNPEGSDFYEGWVVRKQPLSVISTGKAVKVKAGEYQNSFITQEDYGDHLLYVLTLEPDDGDPAPATHILEGTVISDF
jgi:hypothetical protein